MATSVVEIANSALVKIGAQRIITMADANERARVCNEQYDKVRRRLLASHPWGFATKRLALSAEVTAPEFDWAASFALPSDCLRVIGTDLPNDEKWEVENGFLMCNYGDVKIKYIFNQENVSKFSEYFCEALACALAADIAYTLVQSVTLKQTLMQEADVHLRLARSFNAQESTGDRVYADSWLNSRA